MRPPEPLRSEDSPDTSGVTGPVSDSSRAKSPGSSLGSSLGSAVSAAMFTAPEPKPERIGPYRVISELGRGGMGVVYLAVRDTDQFKTRVALKLIKRGMDSEEILRRFSIERQVLSALNHPNIARLIDASTTEDGRPYFVMEYIEGKPIDRHCDDEKMNVQERLALFRQVCSGVQHAHQNLIVHRDIKPGNILVNAQGVPKLMDFGIAKVLNPQLAAVIGDPTELGYRVMTTEYASPEQVRGDPIGTSSDIYSLGVVLYELLTGRRPYRFRTRLEEEIKRVVCDSEPARPSTAVTQQESFVTSAGETRVVDPTELARKREGLPEKLRRRLAGDVDNIVLMAMRKEARRRYASADQMAEDIKRHLDGMPVIASPDRPFYKFSKFLRRNRVAAGSLAAVLVALAGGLGVATYQYAQAESARAVAVERNEQLDAAIGWIDDGLSKVFTAYDTEVSKLEGGIKARQVLVKGFNDHLNAMPERVRDADPAKRHTARVRSRLGDLLGGLRSPTENQPDQALKEYDESLRIRKELAERPGASLDERHDYAVAMIRRADALNKLNRLDDARTQSEQAISILEDISKDSKAPIGARRQLAASVTQRGQILLDQAKPAEAMPHFERARALYEGILAETPKPEKPENTEQSNAHQNARRNVAVACSKLGDALMAQNRAKDALPHYERSLTIRRELEAEESNDRFQRDLAVSLHLTAKALCRLDRKKEAAEMAAESVRLMQKLVDANSPGGARDQRAISNLAEFKQVQAKIDAAAGGAGDCP